jgi:hypothetical protein
MGAWGFAAKESDRGLDTLGLIEANCLKPIGFKHFDVKGISNYLNDYFTKGFLKENEGYIKEGEDYQEYLDDYLSRRRPNAVILIAECLTEYSKNGAFIIHDYDEQVEMRITEFIYTDIVLDEMLDELKKMLDPEHFEYKSWFEDADRKKWIAHMEMMCASIESLKKGICHE